MAGDRTAYHRPDARWIDTSTDNKLVMAIDDLETPAVLVDLDRVEANITRLQVYLDQHDVANWPHVKTHKIPSLAHMQLKAGAAGICCQKVSEAEVMVDAGIENILIPYNIVGDAKVKRLMRLARRARVSVTADSAETVNGLSVGARAAGIILSVLVEFDSGAGRCGLSTPGEAAALARRIDRLPGLRFGGLMSYPNMERTDGFVRQTRQLLNGDGIVVERVSGGGSPCMWQVHLHPEVNEHRAGTYVYGDRAMLRSGAMELADCAMHVLATVVSRPKPDRGILDSGSKSLSSDLSGLQGYGLILEYPEARVYALSEEHGHVDFSDCSQKPAVGERVTVVPNHCCAVTNLFDQVIGVRDGKIEVVWPVAARGKVQ